MQDRLEQLIAPLVRELGYELVLLEYAAGSGHRAVLRLYIDHEHGVGLDDCETVSREVSALLDVEDPVPGEYVLEVSSPGLDRPLVRPEHFARFVGEQVRLRLHEPRLGRRRYTGLLVEAAGDRIRLHVDGQTEEFGLDEIERANLVPDFDREMRRG